MKVTAAYRHLQMAWSKTGPKYLCFEHIKMATPRKITFHLWGFNLLGVRLMLGHHGRRMMEEEMPEVKKNLPRDA